MSLKNMKQKLDEIYKHIDEHFDEHVDKVREYLRQPAVSLTGEGMKEAIKLNARYLEELGAEEVKLVPPEPEEDCYPVVYGKLRSKNPKAKTLLIHSMYDVLPVEPELWYKPPFAAEIVDGTEIGERPGKIIIARGAENQLGPLRASENALDAIIRVTEDMPVNIIFAIEGEEERASHPTLKRFRDQYLDELRKADAIYWPTMEEIEIPGAKLGTALLYFGCKGIIHITLEAKGGDWGGPVGRDGWGGDADLIDAPVDRLIGALSTMKDERGRCIVEGFYDDVRPTTPEEREMLNKFKEIIVDEDALRESYGIKRFKNGLSAGEALEDWLMRPLTNIDALECGHILDGRTYTKIPHVARAIIEMRLVPNMSGDDILSKVRRHLDKHGYSDVTVLATPTAGAVALDKPWMRKYKEERWSMPWRASVKSDVAQAAIRAVRKLGREPVPVPTIAGASGMRYFTTPPLNLPGVIGGLGYGKRLHSQNEFITVEGIRDHEKFVATFLYEYAGV